MDQPQHPWNPNAVHDFAQNGKKSRDRARGFCVDNTSTTKKKKSEEMEEVRRSACCCFCCADELVVAGVSRVAHKDTRRPAGET